jgi:hypothetical protein
VLPAEFAIEVRFSSLKFKIVCNFGLCSQFTESFFAPWQTLLPMKQSSLFNICKRSFDELEVVVAKIDR